MAFRMPSRGFGQLSYDFWDLVPMSEPLQVGGNNSPCNEGPDRWDNTRGS